jgi:hypothetical protein
VAGFTGAGLGTGVAMASAMEVCVTSALGVVDSGIVPLSLAWHNWAPAKMTITHSRISEVVLLKIIVYLASTAEHVIIVHLSVYG